MTITFYATYEIDFLKPREPLTLAEGSKVRVTLYAPDVQHDLLADVVGIGTSGRSDGAATHDHYVYGKRKRR